MRVETAGIPLRPASISTPGIPSGGRLVRTSTSLADEQGRHVVTSSHHDDAG